MVVTNHCYCFLRLTATNPKCIMVSKLTCRKNSSTAQQILLAGHQHSNCLSVDVINLWNLRCKHRTIPCPWSFCSPLSRSSRLASLLSSCPSIDDVISVISMPKQWIHMNELVIHMNDSSLKAKGICIHFNKPVSLKCNYRLFSYNRKVLLYAHVQNPRNSVQ